MENKELISTAEEVVRGFLLQLGLDAELFSEIEEKNEQITYVFIKLKGENLQELIGYRGLHLESMQIILSLIFSKKVGDRKYRMVLDINDFKVDREDDLKSYALRAAEQVKSSGQTMELRPMKPYERRIVHMTLREEEGIETESLDEGRDRHIKISPTELF